jgi:predicted dithiol-disulfide oxidoreductase (DUF899 family)
MEHLRYPNESTEYRTARNALLNDEIALRAQIETVAAKRRALPPGGKRRGKAHGPESGTSNCSQVLNRTSRGVGTRTRLGPSLARVYGG